MTIAEIRLAAGDLGKMKTEEKLSLGVFLAVVVCWMLPGVSEGMVPGVAAFFNKIGYAVPPLAGACLLCMIRVGGRPLLTFRQWMNDGVEWGSTMLCAAIMAIGVALSAPGTGISELLTGIFQPLAESVPAWAFILISIAWVVLQTNLMPNLVSMTLVYSVMVPVAAAAGIGNPVALGAAITAASNCAFSLPSATTTTALVVGTGWVRVGFLGRHGAVLLIPLVLVFTFVCYSLCSIIFS
jgi:sodium-dependent dicarboxylate transporter 2/3/5